MQTLIITAIVIWVLLRVIGLYFKWRTSVYKREIKRMDEELFIYIVENNDQEYHSFKGQMEEILDANNISHE